MEEFFFNISKKNYLNLFSRATSGIYALLSIINQKNKYFIFPSTICPSVIYGAIFSNTNFIFCDVDSETGNLDTNYLKKILKKNKNVHGIFAANMYGIPCNFDELIQIKKKYSLFLIEDCAQSFGSKYKNNYTGSFGDASIFSFGYSKNFDLGGGGIILSNDKMLSLEIEKVYAKLNYTKLDKIQLSEIYKKQYFKYANSNLDSGFLNNIQINKFRNLFLYRKKINFRSLLKKKIKRFYYLKDLNYKKYLIYAKTLGRYYKYTKINNTIFPWRFNFFLKSNQRNKKLNLIWKNNGHANKLYPSLPKFLFGIKKHYPGSELLEKKIINLPLNEEMSLNDIRRNANLVFNILKDKKFNMKQK